MKSIYKYLILLLGFGFVACQETVIIDPETSEPRLVVEGLVTTDANLNYVRLSKSRGFYESGPANAVTNAYVTVKDDQGREVKYVHNPYDNPDLEGYYLPETAYAGVVGRTYTLSVESDGTTYSAQETLFPVTKIDSLKVELNEDEMEDPEDEGRFYEVLFYASEPQDREDYYLFKFYRNGELMKDTDTDIYFADDEILGEKIDDLPIAGYYAIDDVVKVEMYSISRQGFLYYSDLSNLLNNDGGMFSPPPANPRTNLSNGAMGYFQVSALERDEIVVSPPED